ncbi:MAG TPA: hypothetical protein VMU95_40530 [Trebonia sp.]|nr:hypothetical protein [Trebonia sp.]
MSGWPGFERDKARSLSKSALRTWIDREKIRTVEVASPLPPDECVRRLAKATTHRKNGWYLDSRTATLPDPLFHGTVDASQVHIALFQDMLSRSGSQHPVWFDAEVGPGPDGGTVLLGTVGSAAASGNAVAGLLFLGAWAVLAVFFFVLGIVQTALGHFNLGVGAAIGIPVLVAFSILVARDSPAPKGEGRIPQLLRAIYGLLNATPPFPDES